MDRMLEGGFPFGCISLVYGEAAVGKTTLAIQSSVSCTRQGFKVLYIDVDQSFSPQRLAQIACLDSEGVGQNILVFLPETFSDQSSIVENLESYIATNVKLIVVDSVSSLYRASLGSAEKAFALNRELNRQMAYLAQLALRHDLCVLALSQVHSVLDAFGEKVEPVAKRVLFHWPRVIISMRPTMKVGNKEAVLERYFSIESPNSRCYFTLTERGLEDSEH